MTAQSGHAVFGVSIRPRADQHARHRGEPTHDKAATRRGTDQSQQRAGDARALELQRGSSRDFIETDRDRGGRRFPASWSGAGGRHHGRRLNLRISGPVQVVGGLQRKRWNRAHLSGHRLRRRDRSPEIGDVDFAASDAPLKPAELRKLGLLQFPLVIGGVVPIVNIEGVEPGEIKFTGSLLADIFLGKVAKWNDPKIVSLNPGVKLPASAIIVVHRVDASGTTFNWVNYLSKMSAEWRGEVGEGLSVAWPVGVGGKGNDGVASFVKQTRNSIGYVEHAYAVRSKLTYGLVQNKAGRFVLPGMKTFEAAAASADWGSSAQDFYVVITDSPGEEAYPIAATSFALMYKTPKVPARTKAALAFFRWALQDEQKLAGELGYVALPPKVVSQVGAYWKARFADAD
jgi:phosphate transport system substrate-binding protein